MKLVLREPSYDGLQLPADGVVALCWQAMTPSMASNTSPDGARVVPEPPFDGLQLPTDGIMACWTHAAVLASTARCSWDIGHSLTMPLPPRPPRPSHV